MYGQDLSWNSSDRRQRAATSDRLFGDLYLAVYFTQRNVTNKHHHQRKDAEEDEGGEGQRKNQNKY